MVIQPLRTTERMRRPETAKHPSEGGCQANAGSSAHGMCQAEACCPHAGVPCAGLRPGNQVNQQGRMQLLDRVRAQKMQLQELGPFSDM